MAQKNKKHRKFIPKVRKRRIESVKHPGTAPGTVHHTGEKRIEEVTLTIHDYDEHKVDEIHIHDIEEAKPYLEDPSKTWIKVCGLHDIEKLKTIWSYFNLHPLVQEDIVSITQRPKTELYEHNIFFVLRMLYHLPEQNTIDSEQISIVLGENYVLSFQESDRPFFAPILERLKIANTRIRSQGPDYLAYALIDTIVDHYFKLLEFTGDHIEQVEEELLDTPTQHTFHRIHELRRELIFVRKAVWPLRDVLNSTIRDDSPFIEEQTKIYLRDVYDHMIQIIDSVENYREMVTGLHDMYMTNMSNKMNEVMKVLTIIATIFIPLTFVAGIYGMNFDPGVSPWNMPELSWYWGYPAVMLVMLILTIGMIIFFRKKKWL